MIRDITLGQYYPTDSVIHRLDPPDKAYRDALRLSCRCLSCNKRLGLSAGGYLFLALMHPHYRRCPSNYMVQGSESHRIVLMLFTVVFNLFI